MLNTTTAPPAPALEVADWIRGTPTTLDDLRGRVVMLETFQMLCPGCVSHGLPLAQRVRDTFDPDDVTVIGIHTVFEHHAVMGRDALDTFLSEYRWTFPVAIDRHDSQDPIPVTMRRYRLQGTPSTVLIDRDGRLRLSAFGAVDELALGAALGRLLAERRDTPQDTSPTAPATSPTGQVCEPGGDCS
jgi:peroxiredoxin